MGAKDSQSLCDIHSTGFYISVQDKNAAGEGTGRGGSRARGEGKGIWVEFQKVSFLRVELFYFPSLLVRNSSSLFLKHVFIFCKCGRW